MNTVLRIETCSRLLCVLCLAAAAGCGGKGAAPAGDAASNGSAILGRTPANHRANSIQCGQPAPAGTCACNGTCPTPSYQGQWACASDGDCADAGINGRCAGYLGPAGCGCTYDQCVGDIDCPAGQTCACHGAPYMFGSGNMCVPGNCHVDADCGTGGYCSPSPALPCNMNGRDLFCQGVGYYCHTPKDECVDDSDCQGVGFAGCVYDPSPGYWKCEFYAQPV
jgi:hypothetical protein